MAIIMYRLAFFVPETHIDQVKEAVFAAGAGRMGAYEACSWQVLGQGQFRPVVGATPFIGKQGTLEVVSEYRVEMLCDQEHIHAAIEALKNAHPYEEPAFEAWHLDLF